MPQEASSPQAGDMGDSNQPELYFSIKVDLVEETRAKYTIYRNGGEMDSGEFGSIPIVDADGSV